MDFFIKKLDKPSDRCKVHWAKVITNGVIMKLGPGSKAAKLFGGIKGAYVLSNANWAKYFFKKRLHCLCRLFVGWVFLNMLEERYQDDQIVPSNAENKSFRCKQSLKFLAFSDYQTDSDTTCYFLVIDKGYRLRYEGIQVSPSGFVEIGSGRQSKILYA
jgi:hypothetical protein